MTEWPVAGTRVTGARVAFANPLECAREVIPVQLGDEPDSNLLRAGGLAFVLICTVPEPLPVVLGDHGEHAVPPLGLTLGQAAQVRDLGRDKQHGGRVLARGRARPAADARGRVHGPLLTRFRDRDGVPVRRPAGVDRDEPAGLDDPIE
jgi:hypothetical protein